MKMTMEQAVEHVNKVILTCLGPKDQDITKIIPAVTKMLDENKKPVFDGIDLTKYKTVDEAISGLLSEGKNNQASAVHLASRKGCGYSFNKIVLSNPLDGKDHAGKCPGCGRDYEYTAPYIEIVPEEVQA